jgi:hypothetical protein
VAQHFCQNKKIPFVVEKVAQNLVLFWNLKKLPNANNSPIGEKEPNLVTLVLYFPGFELSGKQQK